MSETSKEEEIKIDLKKVDLVLKKEYGFLVNAYESLRKEWALFERNTVPAYLENWGQEKQTLLAKLLNISKLSKDVDRVINDAEHEKIRNTQGVLDPASAAAEEISKKTMTMRERLRAGEPVELVEFDHLVKESRESFNLLTGALKKALEIIREKEENVHNLKVLAEQAFRTIDI